MNSFTFYKRKEKNLITKTPYAASYHHAIPSGRTLFERPFDWVPTVCRARNTNQRRIHSAVSLAKTSVLIKIYFFEWNANVFCNGFGKYHHGRENYRTSDHTNIGPTILSYTATKRENRQGSSGKRRISKEVRSFYYTGLIGINGASKVHWAWDADFHIESRILYWKYWV